MEPNRTPHPNQQSATAGIGLSSPLKTRQFLRLVRKRYIFTGIWALIAALATATDLKLVKLMEYQVQTLFFEIRGPIIPPNDIAILTIDEQSLSVPEQYYRTNPQKYSYLKPLQAWPWQRSAYAQVLAKLMAAGAKAVALDIVLASPSSYGTADDRHLAQVLQRYAGKITLAAEYEELYLRQGRLIQLTQPERMFWTEPMSTGFVNFPLEPDGRVHRFASNFPKVLAKKYQNHFKDFAALSVAIPSFEQAVVAAAQLEAGVRSQETGVRSYRGRGAEGQRGRGAEENININLPLHPYTPTPLHPYISHPSPLNPRPSLKGDHIYFYGPARTFEQIPFWHVLDSDNWNTYLQQGKYFRDKIVIIGATATSLQDFHKAPFSQSWLYPEPMPGVEIQANAIATLLEKRSIAQAIPSSQLQGLFVLLLVAGTAVILTTSKHTSTQIGWALGATSAWGSISYVLFIHQQLIVPTAVPIMAIALCGCSCLAIEAVSKSIRKKHSQHTYNQSASFPVVQENISQPDDRQQLLQQPELATTGKILGGRYKIIKVLAAGGFGETYVAEDNQRPGKPQCVVKRLKLAVNDAQHLQLARRLFQLEAETLEKLGKHDQIPQLLAYFEQDAEFYLVQELIIGHPLNWELKSGRPVGETEAVKILQDLLQILTFVHSQYVIHRDIKPSNIMRRHSDRKLVLIDFGAVKQVSTQLLVPDKQTHLTVGIGTIGYIPSEQSAGHAFFSSDIYAVGMTIIRAVTGLAAHELPLDPKTGEVLWTDKAQISPELAEILRTMVRYDFTQRYRSASEALFAVNNLINSTTQSLVLETLSADSASTEDSDTSTAVWIPESTEIPSDHTRKLSPPSTLDSFD